MITSKVYKNVESFLHYHSDVESIYSKLINNENMIKSSTSSTIIFISACEKLYIRSYSTIQLMHVYFWIGPRSNFT